MIDTIVNDVDAGVVPLEERLWVEALAIVIMNFESYHIEEYDEMAKALHDRGSFNYALKKLDLDLKNRTIPPTNLSIEDPPILEWKELPSHL